MAYLLGMPTYFCSGLIMALSSRGAPPARSPGGKSTSPTLIHEGPLDSTSYLPIGSSTALQILSAPWCYTYPYGDGRSFHSLARNQAFAACTVHTPYCLHTSQKTNWGKHPCFDLGPLIEGEI